jgi:hypothetical protein
MKQKWIGVYSYDAASVDEIPGNALSCELHLETDAEGGITGQLVDSAYSGLTQAEVTIRGFVEEDFLSLVAHYPFKMYRKPNGEFRLDNERIDHEVPFYGELSEDKQEMIGTCEEIQSTFLDDEDINDQLKVGFFKVKLAAAH